jgi:hypothetical protein
MLQAGPSDGIMRCGGVARLQMVAGTAVDTKEYVQQLKGAKEAVRELVTSKKSNPILVSPSKAPAFAGRTSPCRQLAAVIEQDAFLCSGHPGQQCVGKLGS